MFPPNRRCSYTLGRARQGNARPDVILFIARQRTVSPEGTGLAHSAVLAGPPISPGILDAFRRGFAGVSAAPRHSRKTHIGVSNQLARVPAGVPEFLGTS